MNYLFEILGSLGIFMLGMKFMSDGLQKASGSKLRTIMGHMTRNRFMGIFTGFFTTSLIQSSSATTVMVVSFVNAGLLTLRESVGVIMGANIGTTVTLWIVAIIGKIKVSALAMPAIGIGFPLILFRSKKWADIGQILVGFGLLFLGLQFLKEAAPDVKSHPEYLEFLNQYTDLGFLSILIFIVVGTVLTVTVQSSSAATAITLTMAMKGWIDFPTACAMVLGENIGTTITAYLASIGTNVNARRAARVHLIFNVLGVFWMLAAFPVFTEFIDWLVSGDSNDNNKIGYHMSLFHTCFNIMNTLVFLAFVPQLAKLVEKLVQPRPDEDTGYHLKYIPTGLQGSGELSLLEAREEISRMTETTEEMCRIASELIQGDGNNTDAALKKQEAREKYSDQMEVEITRFLRKCSRDNLTPKGIDIATAYMRIVNELESIADCCYTLSILGVRRHQNKHTFSERKHADLDEYASLILDFIRFNKLHLENRLTSQELKEAYQKEAKINSMRNQLRKVATKAMSAETPEASNIEAGLNYLDIIRRYENIGDYCLNISQALRSLPKD